MKGNLSVKAAWPCKYSSQSSTKGGSQWDKYKIICHVVLVIYPHYSFGAGKADGTGSVLVQKLFLLYVLIAIGQKVVTAIGIFADMVHIST